MTSAGPATTPAEPHRSRILRQLERVPLLRWFIRSLPGRLSAVFLLAATVTLAALLYSGPRLERALVGPRERSVSATLSVAAPYAQALDNQFTVSGGTVDGRAYTPTDLPAFLAPFVGTGPQQLTVFRVTDLGTPGSGVADLAGRQRPSPQVLSLAKRQSGKRVGTTAVDDVRRVEAAQVVSLPSGGRVVVAVWQPITDIQDTVKIARQRILVAGIGGAAVALLLGVWVTTRLTRRIRQLEAGARKVAQGDFTARFRGEGSLELASLARALDEMQRQLAELETARRRFIATASHELRTPLSTLQGFLELLEDDQLDPARRHEFVMHASQQAQRLGKLASDLLDLSRLDVGSVEVRRSPVDVGMLLEGLLMEFRVSAEQHGDTLERSVDPRAETALIDGDRVLQVLRALVHNALNHTPAGTTISVRAARYGPRIDFTVTDDGPGIPVELQREMFEAFVTSDETRGSGLGLAISRELARRMKGDLTVQSGSGSTVFTLSLPA